MPSVRAVIADVLRVSEDRLESAHGVGSFEGPADGIGVGSNDGADVGDMVGPGVGNCVGRMPLHSSKVRSTKVGPKVGSYVGPAVGSAVGGPVGSAVGSEDGASVGASRHAQPPQLAPHDDSRSAQVRPVSKSTSWSHV